MITLQPIGFVRNTRTEPGDDDWGELVSAIELVEPYGAESLQGLEVFSHAEIIFHFDRVGEASVVSGARHPRDNPVWPAVGIFAQRGKDRPNRLGLTIATIFKCEGRRLYVSGLDALDGTPVLDIKPVMAEFLPRGPVRQPAWSHELMQAYWKKPTPSSEEAYNDTSRSRSPGHSTR
jgi:tRNA-Thr(GGU) m(6)t(6)A37 methyltransferase TsaA